MFEVVMLLVVAVLLEVAVLLKVVMLLEVAVLLEVVLSTTIMLDPVSGVFAEFVKSGAVEVLNSVVAMALTRVVDPEAEVAKVVRVAVGTRHSTDPLCADTNTFSSAKPFIMDAREQVWAAPPAHSLRRHILARASIFCNCIIIPENSNIPIGNLEWHGDVSYLESETRDRLEFKSDGQEIFIRKYQSC